METRTCKLQAPQPGDENLHISYSRSAAVTAEVDKELITNTTSDLEEHLQGIEEKLQNLYPEGTLASDEDAVELQRIEEERQSTVQCLSICDQVAKQVDKLRPSVFEDVSTAEGSVHVDTTAVGGFRFAKSLPPAPLIHVRKISMRQNRI